MPIVESLKAKFLLSRSVLDLRFAFVLIVGATVICSIGLIYLEGLSVIDALYMSIITISTVGFGEVRTFTPAGRLFLSVVIIFNTGILAYALAAFTYFIIEGKIFESMFKDQMQQRINRMRNHTIVCGYGKYGKEIVDQLKSHNMDIVVIDTNEEKLQRLIEDDKDSLYVVGDATDDEILDHAGIKRANSLISALDDDSDNLFITMSARELNKQIRLISRAKEERSRRKIIRAGADHVIMPEQIGGYYMASLISKPGAVEFFSYVTNQATSDIGFEEISYNQLPEEMRGKKIQDIHLRAQTGVNIIGHRYADGHYEVNPGPESILQEGDIFIVVGNTQQIDALANLLLST